MLGPESLGRYYYASALASYFIMLAGLGLPIYGAREIARRRGDPEALGRLGSELFAINLMSTAAFLALYAAAAFALPGVAGDRRLMLLMGAGLAANAFSVEYLFLGLEDFANIALRAMATKALALIALFAFIRGPDQLLPFAAIGVAAAAANTLLGFLTALRRVRLRLAGPALRAHAAPLAAIAANLALVCVYNNLDTVLLGLFSDARSVSLYNAGVRVNRILVAVISSAGIVMIPRMSWFHEKDMGAEASALAAKSLTAMCFLAFPAAAFTMAAAPELTALVFGPAFAEASTAMRICAPLTLICGFTNFIGLQVLLPRGEERLMLAAVGAAAAVDVLLIMALAPSMAHDGAAIALLAAELTVLAVQAWAYFRRHSHTAPIGALAWRYLLACPMAALAVYAGRMAGTTPAGVLAAALALGTPAYLGTLLALRDPLALSFLGRARSMLGGASRP